MVTTRAAMESRLEGVERSVTNVERQQEEQGRVLANLSRQMDQLLRERSVSHSRGRNFERRFDRHGQRREPGRHERSARREVSESRSVAHSRTWEENDRREYDGWGGGRPPRRTEAGRKIELPIFSGDDAYGWLVRVERYFRVNQIEDHEKLELVLVAMEGDALTWFQWWEEQAPFPSWRDFKEDIIKRFQPGVAQNPYGPLLQVRQTGTVMQYRREFEVVAGAKRHIDPEMLMCIFLNGLKKEIRAEMKVGAFPSLNAMMDRALELETRNLAWRDAGVNPGMKGVGGPSKGPTQFRAQNWVRNSPGGFQGGGPKPEAGGVGEKRVSGMQRLTQEELQERQRRGLCFRCGDKWNPEHVCKMRHLQFVLLEEEAEVQEEEEDAEPEGEEALELKALQLSSHSFWGLTSNKSLKVWGEINGERVVVLVDSGATANFISLKLVEELKLPMEKIPGFKVEVGNGAIEEGHGVCKGVELTVQGIHIVQNFFVLGLGRSEVVLGVDWLASLGPFRGNYQDMTIVWREKGCHRMLKGDPTLCRSQSPWKTALKALKAEGEGSLVTPIAADSDMDAFDDIFQVPAGLPLRREQDYAITLREGAEIPHIRPYRYPHYQKNEIEKIIDEMLQYGIIRPNTSPFSSPVILVKKKMGVGGFV